MGGGTSSLAWRTLDAQYWGVPQRRKRIFLVADFDGRSAGEILFVEQGLHGDSSESEREGQEAAGNVGESIDSASGFKYRQGAKAGGIGWQNGKAPTLELSQNCAVLRMRSGCAGGGKGPLVSENKSLTLATSNDQTLFTLDRASFNQGKNAQYNFKIGQDEIADTLVARGPGAVAILGDKDDLQDNRESPK